MAERFNRDWVATVYFPNRYFHIHHNVYNGYSKIWEINKVQYDVFKKVEYEHSNFRRPLQSLLLKYTTENLQVM